MLPTATLLSNENKSHFSVLFLPPTFSQAFKKEKKKNSTSYKAEIPYVRSFPSFCFIGFFFFDGEQRSFQSIHYIQSE